MENWQVLVTVATTLLGSSAFFGFIEYILDRRDKRSEKYTQLESQIIKLQDDVNALALRAEAREATSARTRIIQASDELRMNIKHSLEFFNQVNDDITMYTKYCNEHKDFVNNKAMNAISNINKVYQERLEDNDFL